MAVPESPEVRQAWLAEQVAKVPGATLRTEGSFRSVWAVHYLPPGHGTVVMEWWLTPGSARKEPGVLLNSTCRALDARGLRAVAALSVALGTWLDHEPRPEQQGELL